MPHIVHEPIYELQLHKTSIGSHPPFRKYNMRIPHFVHESMFESHGATKLDLFIKFNLTNGFCLTIENEGDY